MPRKHCMFQDVRGVRVRACDGPAFVTLVDGCGGVEPATRHLMAYYTKHQAETGAPEPSPEELWKAAHEYY